MNEAYRYRKVEEEKSKCAVTCANKCGFKYSETRAISTSAEKWTCSVHTIAEQLNQHTSECILLD